MHLPVLSLCSLSPQTRVLHQLSLHCHTPPSASKECASSSPACLCQVTASFWFKFSLTISLLDPIPPPSNTPSLFCICHTTEQILNSPDSSASPLFFFFSLMWTIFKIFNLLQYCFCCVCVLVFWPWGMYLSSQTRDRTHIPCTGRRSLNHWTSREVSSVSLFLDLLWFAFDSWIVCKVSKNCPLANLIASSLHWCFNTIFHSLFQANFVYLSFSIL